jgi:lysyl-tRNA synthetase class 1
MTDIKELALKNNSWPFEEARSILSRLNNKIPKKGYVLFETGYGPSGLPHIGTFCEVARTVMVRNAFSLISDIPTKLFVVSDDMDGLRKIPENIPQPEIIKDYLGMPLTSVPDPFGTHQSYGHHMNARLTAFLDRFNFEYEFHSATEFYKNGFLDEFLLKALKHYDEIMNLMLPTLGEERQATYSPFLPICPKTGKVLYVPIIRKNENVGTITYLNEKEEVTIPVTGGHCKLQWKPDFGVRWAALDVNFEMYGKDHLANSSLYSDICKIVGGIPPQQLCYEMFLDHEGKKISKSKGNGITIDEWLKYAPTESLSLYMYQSPKKAKRLHFDVIPKSVDEYITFLQKFFEEDDAAKLSNPIWHIHNGKPIKHEFFGLSFALLINLACACNPSDKSVLWGFITKYSPNANLESASFLDKLVDHAICYYNDFVKSKKIYRTPDENDRKILQEIVGMLSSLDKNADAQEIQNALYNIGKNSNYSDLREFFQRIYEILLGQSQGPRIGSFIALYGIDETIKLIKSLTKE